MGFFQNEKIPDPWGVCDGDDGDDDDDDDDGDDDSVEDQDEGENTQSYLTE